MARAKNRLKPMSLDPLTVDEALSTLLQTAPPSKGEKLKRARRVMKQRKRAR
jgi:hypothetical protein